MEDQDQGDFINEQSRRKYEQELQREHGLRMQQEQLQENPYYFSKRIHNSGFWGDNRRRRGTWLVAVGAVLVSMSIVLIAVFWRWWYGPEVNVPCRILAITLLICGFFSIVIGLISNAMMERNRESKHFLGSPPRWSSWVLLIGLVFIIVAADFITFYYSYWHNRFINTPFIITSIILFFFGGIFVGLGLHFNFKAMRIRYQLVSRDLQ